MTESDFKDFFQRLSRKAYTGSDLKTVLIKANSFLASNFRDNSSKKELFVSSIYLAETDIELYIRIMNLCVENSLYCLNDMFVRSSIYLIDKKYAGNVHSLNNNYQQVFYNVVSIILTNEILDEIDIVDSCDAMIILGKYPKIYAPYKVLTQFEDKIFEILNKKYKTKLIENEYDLESNELINHIRKLDLVYTNFGKYISFSYENYSYSDINSERYFQSHLSPYEYDEQILYKFGILLFPQISEIDVTGKKVIINNDGFGNLENCIFTILHKEKGEKIFTTSIDILCRKNEKVYIDSPVKKTLLGLSGNEHLEFRFNFTKFNREYCFAFKKKIGPINEELDKPVEYSVNYDFRYNSGNIASNANNVSQSIEKNNIQKLVESYNELAKLIDESNIESSNREEAETNINEAKEEISKEKWNFSKLEKITENLAKLIDPASKAFFLIVKIKEYLEPYIPK
jgi:hypothetical protein